MATNRRIERMNKTLMKEISEVLMNDVKDPRMTSMISIVDASMASDMRNLKIMVSIYGTNELENLKTFEAINSAAGFISSQVSKSLRLKYAPRITFEKTNSIEQSVSMYFKLKEIKSNEEPDHIE